MRLSSKVSLHVLSGSLLIVAAATFPLSLTAAPRQWTDASGSFSVKAEFVELKDGQVHLKKEDGEVIVVAAAKLSAADRNYLSNRAASKPVAAKSTESKPADTKPADAPATDDSSKSALMKLADTSGDGKIVRTEWTKLTQSFREYDVDKDNALDETELAATKAAEELLNLADSDQDKKITRTEWAALSQSFAKLDKNRDASLDDPELRGAAESSLARASGTATLPGAKKDTGPTTWRGRIEGRGEIELVVTGNTIVGREIGGGGGGGGGRGLGAGTFTMTGNGKSGNMDAVYTEGDRQGQACMGIYEMDGDTLRWCVNNRGQRPVDFNGGGGNWPMVLTRVVNP